MAAVAVTMEPGADGAMTVSRRGRAGRSLFWRQLAVAAGSKKLFYTSQDIVQLNESNPSIDVCRIYSHDGIS